MKTRISRAFALYGFRHKMLMQTSLQHIFISSVSLVCSASYSCFHLHENKNLSGVRPIRIQAEKCLCKQACNTFYEFCLARLQCLYSCFHLHENKNLSAAFAYTDSGRKCLCKQACNTFLCLNPCTANWFYHMLFLSAISAIFASFNLVSPFTRE